MRSVHLAPPFHRAHATKRVLGPVRKSVVGLTHCSCINLRGRTPSERLSCQPLVGGPREAAIGTALLFSTRLVVY
jgi:hypothetical protein